MIAVKHLVTDALASLRPRERGGSMTLIETPNSRHSVVMILRRLCRSRRHVLALLLAPIILFCISYTFILEVVHQQSFSNFQYPLDVNLPALVALIKQGKSVPGVKPINVVKFPYIHPATNKCGSEELDVVYLVKSALHNRWNRLVLRQTWFNESLVRGKRVRGVFLLGSDPHHPEFQAEIDAEQRLYHDIVQQDFYDTYNNNTFKTMLGFKWAVQNCKMAKFYFFVDDDYYVNPWRLHNLLNSVPPLQYPTFLTGYIFDDSMPKRFALSKWYISVNEYPFASWPPYPTAGAYAVSRSLAEDIVIGMPYTKYIRFDDVFLGIVAHKLGVHLVHNPEFRFHRPWFSSVSNFKNTIACHMPNDVDEVLKVWRTMNFTVGNYK